ncbi:MAG: hypothetical protein NVSMB18_13920 [Acetobacteraceae bacterium]
METEVFEAFRSIGAPEDKAMQAAAALSRRDSDVGELRRDMLLLRWMVGGLYALVLPAMWLLLRIGAKVGALG